MHVLVTLKDVWSLVQDIVQELSHEESSPLILLAGHVHLVLQLNVV